MTYDYELKENPCIKTGCTAFVAGLISHGDLFDLGYYYLLDCPGPPRRPDASGQRIHLRVETFHTRLGEGKVLLIDKRTVVWFDYDGKPLEI